MQRIYKILIIVGILLSLFGFKKVEAFVCYSTTIGGTGTCTSPTLGQVLVGQANGTFIPQATSTLNISGSGGVTSFGYPFFTASTFGTSTQATSTGLWFQQGLYASSTSQIASTTFSINGNVGIGTTSPYAKLSVAGTIVGQNFISTSTATSTFAGGIAANIFNATSATASSTFADGINLTAGCFAINNTCLSTGGSTITGTVGQIVYMQGTNSPLGTTTINITTGQQVNITKFLAVNGAVGGNAAIEAKSNNTGSIQGLRVENDNVGNVAFSTFVTGDAQLRFSFLADGIMKWSSGATASDIQLSRTAAGALTVQGLNSTNATNGFSVLQAANQSVFDVDTTNGRVGVGTSTPYSKLSVAGQIVGQNFIATSTTQFSFIQGGLTVGDQSKTTYQLGSIGSNATTGIGDLGILGMVNTDSTTNNTIGFQFGQANTSGTVQTTASWDFVGTSHTVGSQSTDMVFATRNNGTFNEKFRLKSSGLFGFGVSAPTSFITIKNGQSIGWDSGAATTSVALATSTTNGLQITDNNGFNLPVATNLYVATSSAIINTTSPTTGHASGIGTTSITANYLTPGKKFTITGSGFYSTPIGNTSTVTLTVKFAATTLTTVTTGALPSSATNLPFNFYETCTIRSIGSSGTIVCDGSFNYNTALTGIVATQNAMFTTSPVTINTTVKSAIDTQASWSAVTTQTATVQESSIDFSN